MSIKTSRPTPVPLPQPSAGPRATGDHVRRLRQDGGTYSGIAVGGLTSAAAPGLLSSGRRAPADTTTVMALTSSAMPRDPVDAGGTRLRLRALHVMGHSSARIARAVGVDPTDHPRPRPRRHHDRQPPAARRDHRRLRRLVGQARPRTHSRRTPRGHRRPQTRHRGNWCAAAALDDDLLDTPGYQPAWGWKPATGTGTAPDIYPPVLQQKRTGTWPTTNV